MKTNKQDIRFSHSTPTETRSNAAPAGNEFARQAYSGNFFAGPHSIFNPMLFRKEKQEGRRKGEPVS